jgi:hypothetical protein
MNRKNAIYWVILGVVIGLVYLIESMAPKRIDWAVTYSSEDKNPYGSYVVFKELHHIFPGKKTESTRSSFYELFDHESTDIKNYICIDQDFSPDELETQTLLEMVNKGNNLFIATESITGYLADTLRINITSDFKFEGKISLNFVNPALTASPFYAFEKSGLVSYFGRYDSTRTIMLGKNNLNRPTYIKIPYGQGNFYISSTPIAFTNYHILEERNSEYVSKSFSYLPVADIVWNEYYKSGIETNGESESPFRFFLSNPPLQWALYLTIISLLVFIFFEAKRKQRIIPVIKPLSNTTLEFTETVGSLYFQYGDHKNIAEKKITYFLEGVRSKYFIKTIDLDKTTAEALALKSGVSLQNVIILFQKINFIRSRSVIAEEDLLALNRAIDIFQMEAI